MNSNSDKTTAENAKESAETVLLRQLRAGDEKAVREWFQLYKDKISSVVRAKIEDPQLVDDLVQEIFIHCLRQIGFFRGECSLLTWMSSIAKNRVADHYRKQYAKKAIKSVPLFEALLANEYIISIEVQEQVQLVQQILTLMTLYYQQLLNMKYVQGLALADIATVCQKSHKSVESDLYRARVEFKQLYKALSTG